MSLVFHCIAPYCMHWMMAMPALVGQQHLVKIRSPPAKLCDPYSQIPAISTECTKEKRRQVLVFGSRKASLLETWAASCSARQDFFSCHRLVKARRVHLMLWYGGDIFVWQLRPNVVAIQQALASLFDGWRVRPCMDIPTNLARTQDPPEHDTQPPAAKHTWADSEWPLTVCSSWCFTVDPVSFMSHYLYFLFPMCHMTVSSPALGSYLTICENVARGCTLWSRGSWLGGALVSALCFCWFLAHRFLYGIVVVFLFLLFVLPLPYQSLGDTKLSSCTLQGLWTDQLTTSRAVFFCCFVCCLFLCALFCFCFAVCFPVFALWQKNGLCIDPISSLLIAHGRQDWSCYRSNSLNLQNAIVFPVC